MDRIFIEKCRKRLDRISENMLHTNQVFSVLMQLRGFSRDKKDLLDISPAFYGCVARCCIEVLFIEINKMFDPDPDSEGIKSLLIKMKENISLLDKDKSIEANEFEKLDSGTGISHKYNSIEQLIEEALKKIDEHNAIINNIKTQRDKYYAHFDMKIDLNTFFEENTVTYNDLETMIVLNSNLFNALYMFFKESTLVPLFLGYDDLKKTVFYVEKGVKA